MTTSNGGESLEVVGVRKSVFRSKSFLLFGHCFYFSHGLGGY